MLSDRKKISIDLYCYACVAGNFASFINEENRGDNFEWVNFPSLMERLCHFGVIINVNIPKGREIDARLYAGETGKLIAEFLLEESGIK